MAKAAGFQVLVNDAVAVTRPDGTLWISALDDYEHMQQTGQDVDSAISRALQPVHPGEAHISLIHNPHPDLVHPVARHAEKPASRIFSGHTHGGQLDHPAGWLNSLLKHWRRRVMDPPYDDRYLRGEYPVEGATDARIYVHSGTGSSMGVGPFKSFPPLRWHTRPEIALFTLKRPEGSPTRPNDHPV